MIPDGNDTRRTAPTLETERLVLRQYRADDLTAQHAIVGDDAVMGQLGVAGMSREETWRRMAASVGMWDLLGHGGWAVVRRADDRIVGLVSLFRAYRGIDTLREDAPEMGWIFATDVHRQGIAAEACRAALRWADTHLATSIWAIITPSNAPSFKLAERLGFERRPDSLYHGEPIAVLERPARA